uniref:Uncharacterized protein n=1 Tax=Ditylenchus dipsaci TaxID=166011 RepID=A0A915DL20_9BILA
MENDDEFLFKECDPERPSTSKAIPTWPTKESMKDLKSSPKKAKRKPAASEKKVKTAVVGKEKTAAVVKEKPVKAKQAKAPAATTQVDVKSIQTFFGYACMSLSKDLKLALAEEHNFNNMVFTPEVIAKTAQIVQTVVESKWAPKLAAFSKFGFL